jgi:ABC-type transport system substrate-binding protein
MSKKVAILILSLVLTLMFVLGSCITINRPASPQTASTSASTVPVPSGQPPQLVSPTNGAFNVPLKPILVWQPVAGAQSYEYFLFRERVDSSTLVEHGYTVNTSTQIENDLQPGTAYYWRVGATFSTGGQSGVGASGGMSEVWMFTTGAG